MSRGILMRIIGQSKVYMNHRISISDIKSILDVDEGDRVIFVEDDGKIIIKKMTP